MDYTPFDEEITIRPEQQPTEHCILVEILEDTIVESNETFSVSLTSNETGVNVGIGEATISIIDNDGM